MKKINKFVIGVLVILIGVCIYYFSYQNNKTLFIKDEEIQQKSFLENKQAVLYLSTTADQDMDNRGISYSIFLDDEGKTSAYKMKGLELGSIAISEDNKEVLLESKDKIRIIGDMYQEFDMKNQYTGEKTGYLKNRDLYFSIYNTGVNTSTGNYDSNVVFGNKKGFKMGNIPYYISTSGINEDEVIILTKDIEKNQHDLRRVIIGGNEVKVENVIQLENEKNAEYASLSSIISDDKYYYFILSEYVSETSENVILFRVNKETLKQEKITVSKYKNNNNLVSIIPFNIKNSTYLYDNELYYINGLGEVFTLNTKTNDIAIKFTIKNAPKDGVRHNEETFFQNGNLYVLRYNINAKNKYYIEVYSLKSGEKLNEIKMEGLDKILSSVKGKSIYSYDFKMLDLSGDFSE
ncbi:hypothetical protein JFL43_20415 [Viridibacillus sp. YIM B01967]|uniref:Lipoprotein n=1 Tax=Viridibacillus soli TaxID=2798301 RepID=A0ABS1HCI7_9BACL|nr:hypothetical protein [Viridibacillus soli]MBK3497150.1 hypothetical protein [Viridibacillus soli]